MLTVTGVDPLWECLTIASTCMTVFRQKFVEPQTIGVITYHGYRTRGCTNKGMKWLTFMKETLKNGNGVWRQIDCSTAVKGGTMYAFGSCVWHGCEKCHPDPEQMLPGNPLCMRDARFQTDKTLDGYKSMYNVSKVMTKWEHSFHLDIKRENIAALYGKVNFVPSLNPRDAFFGGRTNAMTLLYDAKEGNRYVMLMYVVCTHG